MQIFWRLLTVFLEKVANSQDFWVFNIVPYTEMENLDFKACNCFLGQSWKFPRFASFQFWSFYWDVRLGNFFNDCNRFVGEYWTFPWFLNFWFQSLYWNGKLRNFFKDRNCFVGRNWKFLSFSSFLLGPYTEIKNSKISKIFCRLMTVFLFFFFEEVGNFWGSKFLILVLILKSKAWKTRKFFRSFKLFCWGNLEISNVSKFLVSTFI